MNLSDAILFVSVQILMWIVIIGLLGRYLGPEIGQSVSQGVLNTIEAANKDPNNPTAGEIQKFLANQVDGVINRLLDKTDDRGDSYVARLGKQLGESHAQGIKDQLNEEFFKEKVDDMSFAYNTAPQRLSVGLSGMYFKDLNPTQREQAIREELQKRLREGRRIPNPISGYDHIWDEVQVQQEAQRIREQILS